MLRLKNITKNYSVAGSDIEVLKGLNLAFRKNEFVSILGPSGCGKTTTLNIVGGLDQYTDGDLYIAGKSTKDFTGHDWDVYRNQRVGFVFQSYNLIPHQTVLGNVELALTISGISKEERQARAKQALDKVGLKDQYDKKPNQLSGGQCQRVAIARALVNEPEILLADEPTGALDTKTSVQIMDLIKEIAKEKLVIMVTHNPDLAEEYSNRIVRLLDGEVVEDTNPYSEEDEIAESTLLTPQEKEKSAKAKMSWWTAFKLSSRNLLSKRGRTILTCIAGSIGIIGVSMVLSVSNGVKGYIADMQDDMLSGNPITVAESGYDLSSLMSMMTVSDRAEFIKQEGYANVDSMVKFLAERFTSMEEATISNVITQDYVNYILSMPEEYRSAIMLDYGIDISNNIYTDYTVNNTKTNMSVTAIKNTYTSILKETEFAENASLITSMENIFAQAPSDEDYVMSQYTLKSGKFASETNEIMIVLDSDSALTDLVLAQLGYFTQEEFMNIAYSATNDSHYNSSLDKDKFSYEELMGKTFTYYANDDVFSTGTNPYQPFGYNPVSTDFSGTGKMDLEVVGILEPNEDINYGCLSSGFYYTENLTKHVLEKNLESNIVKYLKASETGSITSTNYNGMSTGISYKYNYTYLGETKEAEAFIGSTNQMASLMSSMGGGASTEIYTLSLNNVGGAEVASTIYIYPGDFEVKDKVIAYLDVWNSEGDIVLNDKTITSSDREKITYTDTLSLIISIMNSMINIITVALICFTALSLVVSCVMIAIITYVSVVERVKEIGVIRSLGGRKKDVSNLFNAETLIIGASSGIFGVAVTYILSGIINLISSALLDIGTLASFPISNALIMILLSIVLTVVSGFIPAKKAAKQDPVVALRSE